MIEGGELEVGKGCRRECKMKMHSVGEEGMPDARSGDERAGYGSIRNAGIRNGQSTTPLPPAL